MVKTSVTIQGQGYDIYTQGYDLTRAGRCISFTDNRFSAALFSDALVNENPVEANQLSSCFHKRDQVADIKKQLDRCQLIVIQPKESENSRPRYDHHPGQQSFTQQGRAATFDSQLSKANDVKKAVRVSRSQYQDSAITKEPLHHKLVIEVAGRDLSNKQSIILNKYHDSPSQQQGSVNDHQYGHRSLVTFNNLEPCARSFGLAITMKGEPSPMLLPLNTQVQPYKETTEKKEWDNVVVAIKPMRCFSASGEKHNNAELLRNGWLYVFWQGNLWRELEVKENSALRDVRVDWYRRQYQFGLHKSDDVREAEGHWLTNVWVPYKLENQYQLKRKGIRIAFSETQWSWGQINEIEADTNKLLNQTTSVDAVEQYSKDQSFKYLDGDLSSIDTIQVTTKSTDQRIIDCERKQKIPVVFLNAAANTLNFLFELDPFDSDDRDDLITLQSVDNKWSQTIQVQNARTYKPNWVILEYTGMPKAGLLSMIQDPNDGEPAFYLFQNLTYQDVIALTARANTYLEDDYLEDIQKNET